MTGRCATPSCSSPVVGRFRIVDPAGERREDDRFRDFCADCADGLGRLGVIDRREAVVPHPEPERRRFVPEWLRRSRAGEQRLLGVAGSSGRRLAA
jgi:hypothetical protein